VLYLLAIITGIWVLLALTGTLEQTTTNVLVSIRASHITTPSFIQLATFLIATILVVVYAIFAPGKDITTTDTGRLVAEMKNQTAQLSAIAQKVEASDQSIKNLPSGITTELKELHTKLADQLNLVNRQIKDDNDLTGSHYRDLINSINEVKKSIDKTPGEVKKILDSRKR
jgi:hypothetical protein